MKKVSSFHIICIILVEMLVLDILFFVLIIKKPVNRQYDETQVTSISVSANKTRHDNQYIHQSLNKNEYKLKNMPPHLSTGTKSSRHQGNAASFVYEKMPTDNFRVNSLSYLINSMFKNVRLDTDSYGPREFRIPLQSTLEKSFVATAYDLSYECCGKYPSHPEYGITKIGVKAVRGKTVAVDPTVIPLGSQIYIEFPKEYLHFNGWYSADDTGSRVKGNIIDVFLGESAYDEALKFGRRRVIIKHIVLPENSLENN